MSEPVSVTDRKRALRQAVLARRDAVPAEARAAASEAIFARIAGLDAYRRAAVVLGYHSFGSEPVTGPFLGRVRAEGRMLVLPRVDRVARRLDLYRVDDLATQLRPGVWGIREPDPSTCSPVSLEAIDFVLVPGVAFDARGGRIGYGGGYYDRLLAGAGAGTALVAAALEVQIVPEVPTTAEDRRVDLVVTERHAYAA